MNTFMESKQTEFVTTILSNNDSDVYMTFKIGGKEKRLICNVRPLYADMMIVCLRIEDSYENMVYILSKKHTLISEEVQELLEAIEIDTMNILRELNINVFMVGSTEKLEISILEVSRKHVKNEYINDEQFYDNKIKKFYNDIIVEQISEDRISDIYALALAFVMNNIVDELTRIELVFSTKIAGTIDEYITTVIIERLYFLGRYNIVYDISTSVDDIIEKKFSLDPNAIIMDDTNIGNFYNSNDFDEISQLELDLNDVFMIIRSMNNKISSFKSILTIKYNDNKKEI